VDNFLAAVRTACFLLPWGFVPITVVVVVAFAFSAAAAIATATLGEFCILCHDIRYLLALFRDGFLEKREGIEGRWYGCVCVVVSKVYCSPLGSRCRGRV
jgi:nitrate/TMAO reductase-like tetraheme cytochrome c subunit